MLTSCREGLERRMVALSSYKWINENHAIESADFAIFQASNDFTLSSYQHAGKPFVQVPLCTRRTYGRPVGKDFKAERRRQSWLGSQGFIHKGLDLVLEALAAMPEEKLRATAKRAWLAARDHHTRYWFKEEFRKAVEMALAYQASARIIGSGSPGIDSSSEAIGISLRNRGIAECQSNQILSIDESSDTCKS